MKKVKIFQVDAFTQKAFGGNPAGVVPEADDLNEEEMQAIAAEINCSETAFVSKSEKSKADFHLRFFTPSEEVDLCGHATIAAFYVLAHEGRVRKENLETVVKQETKAGILPVHILWDKSGQIQRVVMEQTLPTLLSTQKDKSEVAKLMGLDESDLELNGLPMQIVSTGLPDLMVPIKNLDALKKATPDFEKLAHYQRKHNFISIHAFTFETENPENDVCVRDFAPSVQINEEAATGTANGALGAYLVINKALSLPKNPLILKIEQGNGMGRPSRIVVEISHEEGRVTLVKVGGSAVIVLEGFITF